MATNMPTHNLSEVLDGCMAYIDTRGEMEVADLMQYIKAPDFPTGATIYGYAGVKDAFETGKGRIVLRGKAEIETENNHEKIIISEIPYGVNKAELIKYIADLVNEKRIDGISNVNDESDRQGMRIVVDVKRDANSSVVLNKLYKMTALQSSFSVNNIALVNGRPKLLNLKDLIKAFVDHRHEVVIRRTKYDLKKAEERAHILEGLIIASDNIDEVIAIIKSSKSPAEAIERLMERFSLSDIQSRAIVEMRLRQLTGLEQDKLRAEYEEIEKLIAYLKEILENDDLCMKVIKDELQEIKKSMPIDRKAEKIKQDKELAKLIEKANKESEELVEYIAPTGSMKSNKNIEVNINGVQYTVPRGVKTNIPRKVAEIIDNSIKQAEFAQGVQDKAAEIAQQAIAEGRI
jgi:DNA gyrase subunit A